MQIEPLLKKAVRKRERLFADTATDCCRLFNGDGDGVPGLTIDRYGGYILMQYFDGRLDSATGDILSSLNRIVPLLPARPQGILLKKRFRPDDTRDIASAMKSVVLEGAEPPRGYSVRQNGILAWSTWWGVRAPAYSWTCAKCGTALPDITVPLTPCSTCSATRGFFRSMPSGTA